MLLTLARVIAAVLHIASATGAAIRHHTAASETRPAMRHAEAKAPGENPASGEPAASSESPATHAAEQDSEDQPGINPEPPVVLAVAVSLLAAGVALAMLAFTALDIREVTHQLSESRLRAGRARGGHRPAAPGRRRRRAPDHPQPTRRLSIA